jgi:hypothetical protein
VPTQACLRGENDIGTMSHFTLRRLLTLNRKSAGARQQVRGGVTTAHSFIS